MMTKIKTVALSFILILCLCGCTANRELDEQSLVCTLCFSGNEEYTVTVEVLTENTEEKKLTTKIHTATGETPEKAVESLENGLSKRLMFDHCAAIILSPEMKKERQRDALIYCVKNPTVNLGTPVVYCEDTDRLFDCKPESAGVGYDIMLTLKELSLEKNSRLYKTAVDLKNIQSFKNKDGTLIRIDRKE